MLEGGSVMCVCTQCSDLAHPHFWINWLPNEEELENFQKHPNRSKNYQRTKILPIEITDKTCC